MTVKELVELGRAPHTGMFGNFSATDNQIIELACGQTAIDYLLNKRISETSDGERQKVLIARALAQDTPIILLDEPTGHLDVINKLKIFNLLKELAHTTNKIIVMATHEIELALELTDEMIVLDGDGSAESGDPENLISQGVIQKVFQSETIKFDEGLRKFRLKND